MNIARDSSNRWLLHDEGQSLADLFAAADNEGPQTVVANGRNYQVLAVGAHDGTNAAEFLSKGGPLEKGDVQD
jgi:hypothetical protein